MSATPERFAINIGRQLGSGGSAIGKILAHRLGIGYFDREILEIAAQESGMRPEFFRERDEKKGFLHTFFHSVIPFAVSATEFYGNQISEEALFKIQSEAIRTILSQQSAVFIGRCADYVLREHPDCLNIFVTANRSDRIKAIARTYGIDTHTALRKLDQGDNSRADYYNFYTSGAWGEASNYHLCINASVLGIEQTADFLYRYICQRFAIAPLTASTPITP
ncbi:MAG: cytidylate kinase-like family protein [Bacteroidales bacterium]|nr:cytidylate kinase-like family protein [Bacteroidales bacterium]